MDEKIKASWEKVLHPETLRTNIISASIFIVAYEMLEESIVRKLRDYYSIEFTQEGNKISDGYKEKVLLLHPKQNPIKSSLLWLRAVEAINDEDIDCYEHIKKCRNVLAHEMLKFASSGVDFDFPKVFDDLLDLLKKIELWWFENLEMSIDPDAYPEGFDVNTVTSGPLWTLQLLWQVALGPPEKAAQYYEEFIKKSN